MQGIARAGALILTSNVEKLVLQGGSSLSGTGNAMNNSLYGNSGDNTLNGGAGADVLTGNTGKDIFMFNADQANGDIVVDFDAASVPSLTYSNTVSPALSTKYVSLPLRRPSRRRPSRR